MNKNILIVLGGAVLVAVLVAMLVQITLGGGDEPVAVSDVPTTQILVASKDLKIGQELQPGSTKWQSWPESSMFPGAIRRMDEQSAEEALEGRLARNLAEGEPLLRSALLQQSKGNLVAATLEPGQRALAIEVSASSMVGGFIGAGDFVDVMLTYRARVNASAEDASVQNYVELNLNNYATETILQNVKVLAVDQTAQPPKDDEKIKVGKTVTLAVSAQDAERLSLASELGQLTLVLRAIGDDQIVQKNWPTISDARLTNVSDEIYEGVKKIKEESGKNRKSVRIYNGQQVSTVLAK